MAAGIGFKACSALTVTTSVGFATGGAAVIGEQKVYSILASFATGLDF